jgi:hypothetical protein
MAAFSCLHAGRPGRRRRWARGLVRLLIHHSGPPSAYYPGPHPLLVLHAPRAQRLAFRKFLLGIDPRLPETYPRRSSSFPFPTPLSFVSLFIPIDYQPQSSQLYPGSSLTQSAHLSTGMAHQPTPFSTRVGVQRGRGWDILKVVFFDEVGGLEPGESLECGARTARFENEYRVPFIFGRGLIGPHFLLTPLHTLTFYPFSSLSVPIFFVW